MLNESLSRRRYRGLAATLRTACVLIGCGGDVVSTAQHRPGNVSVASKLVVSLGVGAGPHSIHLTHDDRRLIVTDYFLNEDDFGKIHLEGDHKVRVLNVSDDRLAVDPSFHVVDFNTSFATGPARPHGIGMK